MGEAAAAFEQAAGLTRNGREQKLLRDRAAACAPGQPR
jgi:predicted RNA polymerase sigma factor